MKKQFKVFWLALLGVVWLVLMASSCHKTPAPEPEPDLPPATQTGANTAGCYINRKPWWPKPYSYVLASPFLEAVISPVNNFFFLYVRNKKENSPDYNQVLILTCENPIVGTNTIFVYQAPLGQKDYFLDYTKLRGCQEYIIDTTKKRVIVLTKIDTTGVGILSGTFEFTAFNNCGDTLHFTQGRFDY